MTKKLNSELKAFTLAEILIALTVIGVLAAILIPTVKHIMPDKNEKMFSKVYPNLQQAVSAVVNDEDAYPADQTATTNDPNLTQNVMVSRDLNYTDSTSTEQIPAGQDKFCYLLVQNLDTTASDCTESKGKGTFTTKDGMDWTMYYSSFPLDAQAYTTRLVVDVNGETNGPNCGTGDHISSTCPGTLSTKPDKYELGIRYDGAINTASPEGYNDCSNTTATLNGTNVQLLSPSNAVCNQWSCGAGTGGVSYSGPDSSGNI